MSDEFVELPSGLRVPASAAPIAPSLRQQVVVRPAASDLGVGTWTLHELRELTTRVPFEPAFVAVSRIAARIWHIPTDGAAQLEAAREVFGDVPLVDRYRTFLERHENGVIFSEQQLFVTQRLLVDHAKEGSLDAELSADEITDFGIVLVHAHDIVDAGHQELEQAPYDPIEMLAFIVQAGAYFSRPALLNSIARSYTLLVDYAQRQPDDRVPLEQWAREDSGGFGIEEQLAIGFAIVSSTHVLDEDPADHAVLLAGPFFSSTRLADREADALDQVSADRAWFADAFATSQTGDVVRNVAWETTPFSQRPFLRLEDGRLVLVSPRSILDWLGDGAYYRLLDSAQRRSTRKQALSNVFSEYYGHLVETYALELMRSVLSADDGTPSKNVYGEEPYGRGGGHRTPDIVIDLEGSLLAFEIRSGFLTRRLRVAGDRKQFEKDLDRLLFKKIRQLGGRVADLVAGSAHVGEVDFANAIEIWPIVVTADITLSEPLYEWAERERPAALTAPHVEPLVIFDIEDLELAAGLIERGTSLADALRQRAATDYRKLEFKRFVFDELRADQRARARLTEQSWEKAGRVMVEMFKP